MSDFFTAWQVDLTMPGVPWRIRAGLAASGVVTFAGIRHRPDLLRLAASIMTIRPHRDAGTDQVTVIRDRRDVAGRPGYEGFGMGELSPHTEGSALARPPGLLMLACARPASSGGESYVADGAAIHADLAARAPRLLNALGDRRAAAFGADTFTGPVFGRRPRDRLTIRLRLDGLAAFSAAGARSLLEEVTATHVVTIRLEPGQGYLLDNRRMLHGRNAFTGQRVMWRIIGDPLPHLTYQPGFQERHLTSAGR